MTQLADHAAVELHAACQRYRAARAKDLRRPGQTGLLKFSDILPASAETEEAFEKLRQIGLRLYEGGGDQAMIDTYDEVVDAHGWRGAFGARVAWDRIGGWMC